MPAHRGEEGAVGVRARRGRPLQLEEGRAQPRVAPAGARLRGEYADRSRQSSPTLLAREHRLLQGARDIIIIVVIPIIMV